MSQLLTKMGHGNKIMKISTIATLSAIGLLGFTMSTVAIVQEPTLILTFAMCVSGIGFVGSIYRLAKNFEK